MTSSNSWFQKNKNKLIPGITNWDVASKQYRNTKVKDLNYSLWFWFHPSAYKLIYYGINSVGILMFSIFTISNWLWGWKPLSFILLILLLGNIYFLSKKIMKGYEIRNISFYDNLIKK